MTRCGNYRTAAVYQKWAGHFKSKSAVFATQDALQKRLKKNLAEKMAGSFSSFAKGDWGTGRRGKMAAGGVTAILAFFGVDPKKVGAFSLGCGLFA
jgi:hypothetical protein